ncbi:MAG: thioredoxin-disulfide reductase [Deltaproteobacteria bacterium]|nr:thioredoxin-disulfide reductase [Deltaproteobacteria bacterium]
MKNTDYDIVVIGSGPAGLTAALYAARARLRLCVLEKSATGGQILVTDWIENYPGFPEGIGGVDLMEKMLAQVKGFDVDITSTGVSGMDVSGPVKRIRTDDGEITTHTVIIASGASPRKLGVPGEAEFFGKGVSVCATCDAPFYRNRVVAAVGGGDTAVQESLFLSRFADKIYLIHRRDELRATKILQERALANDKIEIVWDSVLTGIRGGVFGVEKIDVKNVKTGKTDELQVHGCFIWIGIIPNIEFAGDALELDSSGFIITDPSMQTSVKGVFAAGDVRNTPLRQIATAVGDGAIAATAAAHYLENL